MSNSSNTGEDVAVLTILSDCLKRMANQQQSLTTNKSLKNTLKPTRIYGSKSQEDWDLLSSSYVTLRGSVFEITTGTVIERVSLQAQESN
jgi:hypothetical protein